MKSETADPRINAGELVLNHLNLALKSLQLYPANHATTMAAINKLWLSLAEYFEKFGNFCFLVTRSGLILDGSSIGSTLPGARSLGSQLYRLKLDQVLIQAAIDQQQLLDLLTIICMDPDDIAKAGGVKELLWLKKVSAVTVSQASLKLSHEAEDGIDYANTDIEDRARLAAIEQALLSPGEISELERQLIKGQLEQDTKSLSIWFQTLGAADETIDGATAIIQRALPKIDSLVKQELADEQAFLYRNLAEALLAVEEPLRTELAATLIMANDSHKNSSTQNLIEQLSGEELNLLFSLALNSDKMVTNDLAGLLKKMPLKTERLRDLIPFLKQKGGLDENTSDRLLAEAATKADLNKAIPVESADAAKLAALAGDIDQTGLQNLEKEITDMSESLIEKGALAALSEVMTVETSISRFTRAAHAVQRMLMAAFDRLSLDTAVEALCVITSEAAKRREEPDIFSILKEIRRDAGQSQKLERLLVALESNAEISHGQVIRYVTLLGNPGILALLELLAMEKRQSRRHLICQLLMAASKNNISSLGDKVMDHRWYLVRNVVLILGQIGGEKAIIYLQKAAAHPDARVRIEVAKALPNLGRSAMPLIIGLLHDGDTAIKLETIRAVGKIRSRETADVLIGLIKQPDPLRRRVGIKIEAIGALGALRAENAIAHLDRIAKSRSLFFKAQQAKLSWAAQDALYQIRGGRNGR